MYTSDSYMYIIMIVSLYILSRSSVDDSVSGDLREWGLSFLRSPVEFTTDPGSERVSGVRLEINTLKVSEHVPYIMYIHSLIPRLPEIFHTCEKERIVNSWMGPLHQDIYYYDILIMCIYIAGTGLMLTIGTSTTGVVTISLLPC